MPREGNTEESAQAHSATAAATRSTPASNRRGAARSRRPLTAVTASTREPQSGAAASVTAPPSGRPATGLPPSYTPLSLLVVVVSRINSPACGKATFNAAAGLIGRAYRPGDVWVSDRAPGGDSVSSCGDVRDSTTTPADSTAKAREATAMRGGLLVKRSSNSQ